MRRGSVRGNRVLSSKELLIVFGTLWLNSIVQCYHGRPNVVIFPWNAKQESQPRYGWMKMPEASKRSNRFQESQKLTAKSP